MQRWHSVIHTTLKKARVPLDNPSGVSVYFLPKEIITALYTTHLCEHKMYSGTMETQGAFTHLLFCFVRINYYFSLGSFCLIVKRAKAQVFAGGFPSPFKLLLHASWLHFALRDSIMTIQWHDNDYNNHKMSCRLTWCSKAPQLFDRWTYFPHVGHHTQ